MAIPSPELMKALLADRRFLAALQDATQGYRWRWDRVAGNRWRLVREPYHPLLDHFDWDWWAAPRKTTSTVRMGRPVSE